MCSLHAHLIDSYFIDCLHISLYGSYFYQRDAMLAQVGLLAMALCPSVCLSVSVRLSQIGVLSKWLYESSWFLAWELPSTHPTLYEKEILVSPKIRILPSGTLSRTPDLARERRTLRA